MLGLYLHRDSPVHAAPAGAKLGGLLLVAVLLLALPGWGPLAVAGLLGVGLLSAARLPAGPVLRQMRPVLVILLLFFSAQALLGGVDWREGLLAAGRFGVLVWLATLVTLTTRVSDMVELFERLFAVLRPVGVNPEKAALLLALTIRLIPMVGEQLSDIRMAQRARGVERHILSLFVPLLVKVLSMADDLAAALEARGYDAAEPRTPPSENERA